MEVRNERGKKRRKKETSKMTTPLSLFFSEQLKTKTKQNTHTHSKSLCIQLSYDPHPTLDNKTTWPRRWAMLSKLRKCSWRNSCRAGSAPSRCARRTPSTSPTSAATFSSSTSKYCFLRCRDCRADSRFRASRLARRSSTVPPPPISGALLLWRCGGGSC